MGGASLDLVQTRYNISLLSDEAYLIGGDVYPPRDTSLITSTAKGHTGASKVKHAT